VQVEYSGEYSWDTHDDMHYADEFDLFFAHKVAGRILDLGWYRFAPGFPFIFLLVGPYGLYL
jgi:hypothetical protein